MADLIPALYRDKINCIYYPDSLDEEVDIVFLTNSGTLFEIYKQTEVRSCQLSNFVLQPGEITSFLSYGPLTKHYLVKFGSTLVIVKRGEELKQTQYLTNVVAVVIKDFNNLGKPQLGVNYSGNSEVCIIEMSEPQTNFETCSSMPSMASAITKQVQEMKLRLSKVQQVLNEKKLFSSKLLSELILYKRDKESPLSELDKLVVAIGCKPTCSTAPPKYAMLIGQPWYRFCQGLLLIGIPVQNTFEKEVNNLELFFNIPKIKICKIKLLFPNLNGEYKSAFSLPVNKAGFLIASIKETYFMSAKLLISGVLTYTLADMNEMYQVHFSAITIMYSDMVSGQNELSEKNISEEDLVSIIATAENYSLMLRLPLVSKDVKNVLISLGFCEYYNKDFMVYPFCSSHLFKGMLIKTNYLPNKCEQKIINLVVYARDFKQYIIFVNNLNTLLDGGIILPLEKCPNMKKALKCIEEEVHFLSKTFVSHLPKPVLPMENKSSYEISVDDWKSIVLMLGTLEKHSDCEINKLSCNIES